MDFMPDKMRASDAYKLMISALIPRPIGFVSTLSLEGVPNCAPFSFFMGVSGRPPILAVSIGRRGHKKKDTLRNLQSTGDFAVNMVTEDIAEKMNIASGDYAPSISEFAEAGLTPLPSDFVKSPRIAESPVSMECQVVRIVEIGDDPSSVVFGRILKYHIWDSVLANGVVDVRRLKTIGRLGGNQYCFVREIFEMRRPVVSGAKAAARTEAR